MFACKENPEPIVPTPLATVVLTEYCGWQWPESVSKMPIGYASIGEQLYEKFACRVCHGTLDDPSSAAIGPSLQAIGERWDDPRQYIYESILYPNDYISPDCPTGPCIGPPSVMRQTYRSDLNCDQMADLLAYLLKSPAPVALRTPTPDLPYHGDAYRMHSFTSFSVSRPSPSELLPDWPIRFEDLPKGNAQQGEAWFSKIGVGCSACHSLDDYSSSNGPDLLFIAFQEGGGMTLEQYLYESILYPDAFDISRNVFTEPMPQNYGERLSQQQVADLISYVMTYQR